MVDRLVSISKYSNCQDDVDHFLLNLMSSTAPKKQTPNSQETVISGCIDTVLYQQDDNTQQENIIAFYMWIHHQKTSCSRHHVRKM